MPGDVGLVAKFGDTLASWFLSEEGYGEFKKRKQLHEARERARRALIDHDWAALRAATDELERLSDAP